MIPFVLPQGVPFRNVFFPISNKKLGRNPRSDRDLCEEGNKSPEKK